MTKIGMQKNIAVTKSILMVCNYRTGSTSINFLLAEQYDLPCYLEIFNGNNRYGIGDSLGSATHAEKLSQIQSGASGCFKIMPDQVTDIPLRDVAMAVDKIVYLTVNDFKRQAESWLGMQASLDWGNNGFKLPHSFNMRDLHLSTSPGKTIEHHVSFTQEEADPFINQLIDNWNRIGEFYNEFPGDVICREDYLDQFDYLPYNRKYTWEHDIIIPEFHPSKLFN